MAWSCGGWGRAVVVVLVLVLAPSQLAIPSSPEAIRRYAWLPAACCCLPSLHRKRSIPVSLANRVKPELSYQASSARL